MKINIIRIDQIHIGTEKLIGCSKRHPVFEVKDLEGVRGYLEQHGVKIKEHRKILGVNRISIFDSWHNGIELLEKYA